MIKNYPSDEFSENTVLGICLLDSRNAAEILVSLTEDDFYFGNLKNRAIFRAMKTLYDGGTAIDITTVTNQLTNTKELDKVGGVDYLVHLAKCVTTFKNVEFYIKNLKDLTLLRNLLQEIDRIESDYQSKQIKDVNGFVAECESRINKITERRRVSDFISASEAARIVGEKIQKSHGVEGSITGISTGFDDLDELINGLNKNELIILAARPSVGKSALALNVAFNAAKKTNRPVTIFSLEMSSDMIMKRLFAANSSISYDMIQKGILNVKDRLKLKEIENDIASVPLYIDDNSGSSIDDIVLKSRKLKESKGDLALIVVDYIGLINDPKNIYKDNEQAKVAYFSRRLKMLSGELACPVLCLSQLNRQTDARESKRPQLADLRSSGAIEQDADKVLFLYRPDYYKNQGISIGGDKKGKVQDEETPPAQPQNTNEPKADPVDVIIAKNRSGRTGVVSLFFITAFGRFFGKDKINYRPNNQVGSNYSDKFSDADNND